VQCVAQHRSHTRSAGARSIRRGVRQRHGSALRHRTARPQPQQSHSLWRQRPRRPRCHSALCSMHTFGGVSTQQQEQQEQHNTQPDVVVDSDTRAKRRRKRLERHSPPHTAHASSCPLLPPPSCRRRHTVAYSTQQAQHAATRHTSEQRDNTLTRRCPSASTAASSRASPSPAASTRHALAVSAVSTHARHIGCHMMGTTQCDVIATTPIAIAQQRAQPHAAPAGNRRAPRHDICFANHWSPRGRRRQLARVVARRARLTNSTDAARVCQLLSSTAAATATTTSPPT
jgi:hypothetical protein